MTGTSLGRVLDEIDQGFDELIELTRALVSIPSVNPPGREYDTCADLVARKLHEWDFDVVRLEAPGGDVPRPNVLGSREVGAAGPTIHLNGHVDVVPPGDGWTTDPFGAEIRDGRIYGRGSCDMKAGLACAMFAAECVRRAGAGLRGAVQVSATVDEESGGFAGVGHLADTGVLSGGAVDYAIIPEPFGPTRVCVGHRGVLWSRIRALGRTAHGSMSHLGRSAIDDLTVALEALRTELSPSLSSRRTGMPVVPEESRVASINVNGVWGGQGVEGSQSPCVADLAEAVLDRRFILEEDPEAVRGELESLLHRLAQEDPGRRYEVEELMFVPPVQAPEGSPLVGALERGIGELLGEDPTLVASPGTYDQKHFARAGVHHCVAYGPGRLELAHQPDEWVGLEEMRAVTRVLAFTLVELLGG